MGASQAQQTTADAGRVLEWMRTPNRKPANLAFYRWAGAAGCVLDRLHNKGLHSRPQNRVAGARSNPPQLRWLRMDVHRQQPRQWMRSGIDKADAEFMYTATQMHDHFAAGVRSGMGQSQWQPIETAPKDGRSFDVWVKSTKNPDYGYA